MHGISVILRAKECGSRVVRATDGLSRDMAIKVSIGHAGALGSVVFEFAAVSPSIRTGSNVKDRPRRSLEKRCL